MCNVHCLTTTTWHSFNQFSRKTSYRVCKPALLGACPTPGKIGRVVAEKTFGIKKGYNGGGSTESGWGAVQMDCQCICLCYLSLHHKIQKMASSNGGS